MRFALLVSRHFMFERQECPVFCLVDGDRDPADITAKFPSKGQGSGRFASDNLTICVVLNRETTAEFKIARYFRKPTFDTHLLSQSAPQVTLVGRIGTAGSHYSCRLPIPLTLNCLSKARAKCFAEFHALYLA